MSLAVSAKDFRQRILAESVAVSIKCEVNKIYWFSGYLPCVDKGRPLLQLILFGQTHVFIYGHMHTCAQTCNRQCCALKTVALTAGV